MNLRNFLIFAAIIGCFVGLRLFLAPVSFLKSFGLHDNSTLEVFVRAIGALQIGVAVVNWYARLDVLSAVVKGVVLGNIAYHALTLVVYGLAVTNKVILSSASVLFELFIQVFFMIGFTYFWLTRSAKKT